ncbi:MAG: hypothetical protein KC502_17665 [Myxococcales bacterium]|nr:hypothetical protein [Myxococcales bacterium]
MTPMRPKPQPHAVVRKATLALATLFVGVVCAHSAQAAEIFDHQGKRLVVSGYAQQATGVTHLPWANDGAAKGVVPADSAFQGGTLRVRWGLDWGESVRLDVHNRLLWNLTAPSSNAGMGSLIGVGTSAPPKRWLDLDTELVSGEGFAVQHDLDRLQLSVQTKLADLKIGRQAVTWGFTSLIPVADIWVQQSPFELDRVEKRGVDALRALMYPTDNLELDVVVADRGTWADLSAGARLGYGGEHIEAYAALAKQWRDLWLAGGITWLVDVYKVRAEVTQTASLDDIDLSTDGVRGTLGIDRIGSEVSVSCELSFNGPGAKTTGGYMAAFSSPNLQRGTAYFVGRWYGAAMVNWQANDVWTVSGTAMANLADKSTLLAGSVAWSVGESANLMASVYGGVGDAPDFAAAGGPALGSEFGTYGVVGLMQAIVHF